MSSSTSEGAGLHDARLAQLGRWLERLFGARDFRLAPASADASFRRYFRVERAGRTWIAMDAPPEKEDMGPYIAIASMLAEIGVNAPRVLERNMEEGFLLNTDLGSTTYLAALSAGGDAERFYTDAIDALVLIQARGHAHAQSLPAYDEALLRREMALFPDWFCGRHLGIAATSAQQAELQQICAALSAEALRQPRVFVHRDYHSRNLMASDGELYGPNPGILDFQDAVHGPVTYDLVSLLRDCYVAWPAERVARWIAHYRNMAAARGVACGSTEEFERWFDWMGAQRHLKAIGIFARLWHRDGKPGYLKDIPRTLQYVRTVGAKYDELAGLRRLIDEQILPALDAVAAPPQ